MDRLSALYRLRDAPSEFSVFRVDADNLSYHHVRLSQQYRGLAVFGGELIVHFDAKDAALGISVVNFFPR
ncbi:MAG: hypothetical protein KKG09_04680 [Verrucomicrobia bacterium]|nr:hypothetical protein [Verrucomicrobiota bacterium]MBU4248125.1 hypothetical protein [Verrucomicrobiota bacterium]MBU4290653.1 hypothetical protein [Verrucomicrobiota bacterium]MBU4430011.1 hypothetical protein [Verrucomicrobiota bacterium]MBU4497281.1 hypothetical protein [Verrucomicrobiota bacterium]